MRIHSHSGKFLSQQAAQLLLLILRCILHWLKAQWTGFYTVKQ